jgi:hypothetical protein
LQIKKSPREIFSGGDFGFEKMSFSTPGVSLGRQFNMVGETGGAVSSGHSLFHGVTPLCWLMLQQKTT